MEEKIADRAASGPQREDGRKNPSLDTPDVELRWRFEEEDGADNRWILMAKGWGERKGDSLF